MTSDPYKFDLVNKEDYYIVDSNSILEITSGDKWFSNIRKGYQRGVVVIWNTNESTIEPILRFINHIDMKVYNKIIPILYNWSVLCKTNRYACEMCAFCCQDRKNNDFMCGSCSTYYSWLYNIICNCKIKRGVKRNFSDLNDICENLENMEI